MKSKNTRGSTGKKKLKTGFAAMSKEKRTEIARKGGRAAAKAGENNLTSDPSPLLCLALQ
jgi:general stress protein YciG